MRAFLEVALTGVTAVLLHPLRSLATVACLLVVLVPYLTGSAVAGGVEREAQASVRFGADLYVGGTRLGRSVPVPLSLAGELRKIPGVADVVPRIVGHIVLGRDNEPAVVVGIPASALPAAVHCVDGRIFKDAPVHELVIGTELARRLRLRTGSVLPPFYQNDHGERLSRVVGVFRSDVSLWQSRLVLTSFPSAAAIFDQDGVASSLLVYCKPGVGESVRQALQRRALSAPGDSATRLRVTSRSDLEELLGEETARPAALFELHFLLAIVAGTLVVMVSSGIGLPDRRREIGILKATGWQTDEVLLRGTVESLIISVGAAALALLIAYVWLKVFNGFSIAGLFLPGADTSPSFEVPYRLGPVPALLGFLYSWVMVTGGTLFASWRAAVVNPRVAMA